MAQYLCLVTVISNVDGGNRPDNTLPVPQPPSPPLGIWGPTDPRPTHPIAGVPPGGVPGQPPLGIWGPPQMPPGIWGPPQMPGGGGGGGGQPPGIWGGGNVPMPTPPIYIPPEGSPPPLGIWGPTDPRPGWGLPQPPNVPTHPIVLPPELPEVDGDNRPIDWKTAWTPATGWVVIGVPSEGTNVPTPSGQSKF